MIRLIFCLILVAHVSAEQDFCGRYAVLTLADQFYISQPYSQTITADFSNYEVAFRNLGVEVEKFKAIGQQYSTIEQIKKTEPYELIPFTPTKNLIKMNIPAENLISECKKINAKALSLEANEFPLMKDLLVKQTIDYVPFRATPANKAVFSATNKLLDIPAGENINRLSKIGDDYFLYFGINGDIIYPIALTLNSSLPAFCEKPNNYWDRKETQPNFVKTIGNIMQSLPTVNTVASTVAKVISKFNDFSKPNSPIYAASQFLFSIPPVVSKLRAFMEKYSNKEAWESSTPTDFTDFLNFRSDRALLLKTFKGRTKDPSQNIFSDFLSKNESMVLPYIDHERLLRHLGLDPDRFGISGQVRVRPTLSIPSSVNPAQTMHSAAMIKISLRIFDKQDKARIYMVQPIIYNGYITTIKYVTQLFRHTQASIQQPTPFSCSQHENEELRICEGFQTAGAEEHHQSNLLNCGRALMQMNETLDIEKCPYTSAPSNPLVYRAECEPGIRSTVLSSVHPIRVGIYCDTYQQNSDYFTTFPVRIQTECEIREVLADSDKVLLPQLVSDFHQDQKVGPVLLDRPSSRNSTSAFNLNFQIPQAAWILFVIFGAAFSTLSILCTFLFLYDKQKCFQILKSCCCCISDSFKCCRNCNDNCCNCTKQPDYGIEIKPSRRYVDPSQHSLASAPPYDENEIVNFLPTKSPAISRKSSIHDIKSLDPENQRARYQPQQSAQIKLQHK